MNVYSILLESCAPGQDFRETELFKRILQLGLISQGSESEQQQVFLENLREKAS